MTRVAPIRVAVVDDHQAVRSGLKALLTTEPGILPVGDADRAEAVWPLRYRTAPDVVLLDYQLPGGDGLSICRRVKSDAPSPAVVLYSAFADASLIVPAIVAGADGIVHKGGPAQDLFEAIRTAARGDTAMPPVPPHLLEAAASAIAAGDLPTQHSEPPRPMHIDPRPRTAKEPAMTPAPAPAPPPTDPRRGHTGDGPLADAIGHYLDRRQAEEIGASESPEGPTTMRQRLLPIAAAAIAVFVLAMALAVAFG